MGKGEILHIRKRQLGNRIADNNQNWFDQTQF